MKVLVYSILLILTFSSCKKVYTCECKRIVNAEDWNPLISNTPIKDTKKNAEATCNSLSYNLGWQDYQQCKIK